MEKENKDAEKEKDADETIVTTQGDEKITNKEETGINNNPEESETQTHVHYQDTPDTTGEIASRTSTTQTQIEEIPITTIGIIRMITIGTTM